MTLGGIKKLKKKPNGKIIFEFTEEQCKELIEIITNEEFDKHVYKFGSILVISSTIRPFLHKKSAKIFVVDNVEAFRELANILDLRPSRHVGRISWQIINKIANIEQEFSRYMLRRPYAPYNTKIPRLWIETRYRGIVKAHKYDISSAFPSSWSIKVPTVLDPRGDCAIELVRVKKSKVDDLGYVPIRESATYFTKPCINTCTQCIKTNTTRLIKEYREELEDRSYSFDILTRIRFNCDERKDVTKFIVEKVKKASKALANASARGILIRKGYHVQAMYISQQVMLEILRAADSAYDIYVDAVIIDPHEFKRSKTKYKWKLEDSSTFILLREGLTWSQSGKTKRFIGASANIMYTRAYDLLEEYRPHKRIFNKSILQGERGKPIPICM